ncbi:hypothetical protein [Anaerolinea thermophila]|uniref:Hypothetical membrane protein n=1 Tax=Anaerolinea thermophila (strain DSM 14523 / JCM 11388 / NBRC 100420 / UNI-1) TaxID=926569 RepID=E8N3W8_ANATU|nr:hypothetical protein [Anaerolinea thermophila]BAJ63132.1 hypothetical membrane protein [Anaerolinea thermophila UNI-1]
MNESPLTGWKMVRSVLLSLLAFLVWLATAALGLVEIFLVRQTTLRIFARFSNETAVGTALGNWVAFFAAGTWLAYVVFAAETQFRKKSLGEGWNLFAWGAAIELLILVLYFTV